MIYTFYSYKGGVGRSMALVNVAELMHQAGLKVIMVDWDLEAPGLERFYPEHVAHVLASPGIIDIVWDYKERAAQYQAASDSPLLDAKTLADFLIDLHPDISSTGRLWLLPAGYRADDQFIDYANRVKSFDWQDFYTNWEGESYFEWLRQQLEQLADVILIDSRTGVTEMGGVCTYQLADVVVMLTAPNEQNIDGTLQLLKSYTDPRLVELRKGRTLTPIVVPARIERVSETIALNEFRQAFARRITEHLPEMFHSDPDVLLRLEIPYVPLYAFEEKIAVNQTSSLSRAVEMEQAYLGLLNSLAKLAPAESRARQMLAGYVTDSAESETLRNRQELDAIERIQKSLQREEFETALGLCQSMLESTLTPLSNQRFQRLQSEIANRWADSLINQIRQAQIGSGDGTRLQALEAMARRLLSLDVSYPVELREELAQFYGNIIDQLEFDLQLHRVRERVASDGDYEAALKQVEGLREVPKLLDSRRANSFALLERELNNLLEVKQLVEEGLRLLLVQEFDRAEELLQGIRLFSTEINQVMVETIAWAYALASALSSANGAEQRRNWGEALSHYRQARALIPEQPQFLAAPQMEPRIYDLMEFRQRRLLEQVADTVYAQLAQIPPAVRVATEILAQLRGEGWLWRSSRELFANLEAEVDTHKNIVQALSLLEQTPRNIKGATELLQRARQIQPRQSSLSDKLIVWEQLVRVARACERANKTQSRTAIELAHKALSELPESFVELDLVSQLRADLERLETGEVPSTEDIDQAQAALPRSDLRQRSTGRRFSSIPVTGIALLAGLLVLGLIFRRPIIAAITSTPTVIPIVLASPTTTPTLTGTPTPTLTAIPTSTPTAIPTPTTIPDLLGLVALRDMPVYEAPDGVQQLGTIAVDTTLNLCALAGERYLVALSSCRIAQPLGWGSVFDIQPLFSGSFPVALVTPWPSRTPTPNLPPPSDTPPPPATARP